MTRLPGMLLVNGLLADAPTFDLCLGQIRQSSTITDGIGEDQICQEEPVDDWFGTAIYHIDEQCDWLELRDDEFGNRLKAEIRHALFAFADAQQGTHDGIDRIGTPSVRPLEGLDGDGKRYITTDDDDVGTNLLDIGDGLIELGKGSHEVRDKCIELVAGCHRMSV